MKRIAAIILAASLAAVAALPVHAAQPPAASEASSRNEALLRTIIAEDDRREARLDPVNQLYRGNMVAPGELALVLTDTLDRRRLASARRTLADLQRIDRARLKPESQVSHDVLVAMRQSDLAWLRPDMRAIEASLPLDHFTGLHIEFSQLAATSGPMPLDDERDYRAMLSLHPAFARVMDNAVVRFRQGTARGVVASRLTTENMIGQLDAFLATPAEQSPFHSPVETFPAAVPESARASLRAAYAKSVRETVYPAYRRLRDYLAREYLPLARSEPGLGAMRGGAAYYRALIQKETTLALDPAEIHQTGLGEVARIRGEMEKVKARLGFSGPLGAFFGELRDNPRYHPSTRAQLDEGFQATRRKVDARLGEFFRTRPKAPLRIEPYPAFREKYEAGGSYYQGPPDGSRPAIFYYNTYDLPSRFLTGIATLYLHEAEPGHHLQTSLAQENESLPPFQRFGGNNAYVEGWALYAETLGFQMGLFDDPMQHWGTLDDEMLRAMRLVVDTGIHAKGWSRQQAIDYMLANSGMGQTDATSEVERYIANPAQALSYKIGALTIQRLRWKAEARLGKRFDIRAFHDQVLGSGALPLGILEAKIDRWLAQSGGAQAR